MIVVDADLELEGWGGRGFVACVRHDVGMKTIDDAFGLPKNEEADDERKGGFDGLSDS